MALYDREHTQSFYSELGHGQDMCFYCEKAILIEARDGKLTRDEMHKKIRALRGKLVNKRVMKYEYVGHDFCVCPECLNKIHLEVTPVKTTAVEPVNEQVEQTEEAVNDKRAKGKMNETKKA